MTSALEKLRQQNAARKEPAKKTESNKPTEVARGSVKGASSAPKKAPAKKVVEVTETTDVNELPTAADIMEMKTSELDELNATLPESLDGWEDLDKKGKQKALIEALHSEEDDEDLTIGEDDEEADVDADEDEDLEEEEADDEDADSEDAEEADDEDDEDVDADGDDEDSEDAEEETDDEDAEDEEAEEGDDIDAELDDEVPAKGAKARKARGAVAANLDPNDLISKTVKEIENMTEEQADEAIVAVSEDIEYNYFRMGGVLAVIKSNKFIGEYKTFREKVEAEFGMKYRKAEYLVTIYTNIVESGVSWQQVKDIGWSKMKEISHIISPDNVEEWVEKAQSMNVGTLSNEVKALERQDADPSAPAPKAGASAVSSLTFKVHEDQKENINAALEKALEEMNLDSGSKSQALEHICLDYMAAGKKRVAVKEMTTKQFFEKTLKEAKGKTEDERLESALSTLLESKDFKEVFGVEIGDLDFSGK